MKKIFNKKKISSLILIILITFLGGVGNVSADPFVGPISDPPNNNVFAPINVSATTQTKSGVLGLSGLAVAGGGSILGSLGVGTSSPTYPLTVVNAANAEVGILGGASNYSILRFASATGPWVMGGGSSYSGYGGANALSLYSPTTIWFRTGATERMRITSAGNIGIGTSTPVAKLDVNGSIQSPTVKIFASGTEGGEIQISDNTGNVKWFIDDIASGLRFRQTGISNQLFLASGSGNVGIGTTLPNAKLTLGSNVATSPIDTWGDYQILLYTGADATTSYGLGIEPGTLWFNSNADYRFYEDGSNVRMIIKSGGNVGIGTTAPSAKLHVSGGTGSVKLLVEADTDNVTETDQPEIVLSQDGGAVTGVLRYYGGTNSLELRNNLGNSYLNLNENGNIGIGTTAPAYKLDVVGDVNFTGNLYKNGVLFGGGGLWTDSGSNIYRNSGNVGIGTTNPTFKLQVHGGIRSLAATDSSWALLANNNNGVASSGIWFDADDGNLILRDDSDNVDIRLRADNVSYFNGGNVGIGTTAPTKKLDVVGDIQASGDICLTSGTCLSSVSGGGGGGVSEINDLTDGSSDGTSVFLGLNAGSNDDGSNWNTGIGINAMQDNTNGNSNIAIGASSLRSNSTGNSNTSIGTNSLSWNISGSSNTAIGLSALRENLTGSGNVAIGFSAGDKYWQGVGNNTSGGYSIFIGGNASPQLNNETNQIVIGYNAEGAGSNSVTLGNYSITKTILKGNVGIGTTTPTQKLDVVGDIQASGDICLTSGTCLSSAGGGGGLWTASGSDIYRNSGNVGIGTPTPSEKLHIANGTVRISGGSGNLQFQDTDDTNYLIHVNSSRLYFMHDANSNMTWDDGDDDRIVMYSPGNGVRLGIGTGTPTQKLDVFGNIKMTGSHFIFDSGYGIINWGPANDLLFRKLSTQGDPSAYTDMMSLSSAGNLWVGGDITANAFLYSSDQKLKKNIKTVENASDKISKLRGVDFNWKSNDRKSIGFIAQEVEKVLPELVNTNKEGMKSVHYGNITAVLVEALKEQQDKIEKLEARLEKLENKK